MLVVLRPVKFILQGKGEEFRIPYFDNEMQVLDITVMHAIACLLV
jgi:hypothetical protein